MHDRKNESYVGFLETFNWKNNIKIKSLHKNYLNIEVQATNVNLNYDFPHGNNNTYERSKIQGKDFANECKDENFSLPHQLKGQNVLCDINIYNPLSPRSITTHN
jgi:hypothetical protein